MLPESCVTINSSVLTEKWKHSSLPPIEWHREKKQNSTFDADYNHLPFRTCHPNASVLPNKPLNFDKMRELAKPSYPQVIRRYVWICTEVNGKVIFRRIDFFHWAVWLRSNRKTGITNSENGLHYHLKQDKMGTVHTIENHLTAINRTIRQYSYPIRKAEHPKKTKIDR